MIRSNLKPASASVKLPSLRTTEPCACGFATGPRNCASMAAVPVTRRPDAPSMPLATAAFSFPDIFRSRSPPLLSGALPDTRKLPATPALIVASSVVRPEPSRPDPATSTAASAMPRICGALSRLILTRQSPEGSPGVPDSAALASRVPVRPSPGAARSAIDKGTAEATSLRSRASPTFPSNVSLPPFSNSARSLMATPSSVLVIETGAASVIFWPLPCTLRFERSRRWGLCAKSRPSVLTPRPRMRAAQIEIAGVRRAFGGQAKIGDRLPRDKRSREARFAVDGRGDRANPSVSDRRRALRTDWRRN